MAMIDPDQLRAGAAAAAWQQHTPIVSSREKSAGEGEGAGLGLSISHDIVVKQHGGSIDVETEPGGFTEFRITLLRASPG